MIRKEIKIRPAKKEDLRAIIELKLQLVSDYPDSFFDTLEELRKRSLEDWQKWLTAMTAERGCLFLAQDGSGKLIGIVGCSGSRHAKALHSANVEGLGVLPEFTGGGVGTELMTAVVNWAKGIPGLIKLGLGVYGDHSRVITFYRRLGFEEEGTLKRAALIPNGRF